MKFANLNKFANITKIKLKGSNMNLDRVTISIKSGNGGNGKVSFHREKFVEKADLTAETAEMEVQSFSLQTSLKTL